MKVKSFQGTINPLPPKAVWKCWTWAMSFPKIVIKLDACWWIHSRMKTCLIPIKEKIKNWRDSPNPFVTPAHQKVRSPGLKDWVAHNCLSFRSNMTPWSSLISKIQTFTANRTTKISPNRSSKASTKGSPCLASRGARSAVSSSFNLSLAIMLSILYLTSQLRMLT